MTGNPILRRELLQQLRAKRTLWGAIVVALVTGGLVLLRWPSTGTADLLSGRSFEVFRPLAYALTAATVFLVPAVPGTSIVRERKQNTLPMLLHAPLSPWSIFGGKLLAYVLVAAILLSAALPAIAASCAMGGITLASHVLPLGITLLGMTIVYTAAALWVSSRAGSADESLRWSYALILTMVVGTLGLGVAIGASELLITQFGSTGVSLVSTWLQAASPIPVVQAIVGDASIARNSTSLGSGVVGESMSSGSLVWSRVWHFLILAGIGTVAFSVAAMWRLRPSFSEVGRVVGRVTNERSFAVRVFRRVTFLVDPNRRSRGIPLGVNPVMVKEFRTRRFGRMHWLLRLVLGCAVVSMALAVVTTTGTINWGAERVAAVLVVFQIALLILLGPSLASGLIAGERENGGWQVLRMTPLSGVRVLSGKLFSVIWTLAMILMATLPGYLVMVAIDPSLQVQVQRVLVCLAVTAVLVLSISTCVSAFNRRTAAATAINYSLLLILFVGTILVWLARDRPFGHRFVERVLSANPAAAALAEIDTPGFEAYELLPISWIVGAAISLAALVTLCVQTWRLYRVD